MPIYHGNNLRRNRYSATGHYYLLTAVTKNRRPLFRDFRSARICINGLRRQHEKKVVNSLAFVIMPDHFHWLVELRQGNLATLMQMVRGRVSRQINLYLHTSGAIWQPGYHDHALRQDEDLRQAARYLAANPLRAGLVNELYQYPHWDAIWLE